jgi:hypothetical protein
MKTKISFLVLVLAFAVSVGYSQEKSKKEIKAEKKLALQKQIEEMVNSKEFVFVGRTAMPSGHKSVSLTTNTNYVKFHPDLIDSYMPYYGRAYSGVGYGGDQGLKFTGKPEVYTITKGKKDFEVNAEVKGDNDTFKLSLSVGFEGNATLGITSNNRSFISYYGEISAPEKKEEKK